MSSPALSPELSEKNKKYDRQLRYVWLLQAFFHYESSRIDSNIAGTF